MAEAGSLNSICINTQISSELSADINAVLSIVVRSAGVWNQTRMI